MDFRSKLLEIKERQAQILVVGLGMSGVHAAEFCLRCGIQPVCIESQSEEEYFKNTSYSSVVNKLRQDGIKVEFGVEGEGVQSLISNVSLAVVSPGVPVGSPTVAALTRAGISYVSELELGVELLGLPSIVVTGSNGKSTTVSLIAQMLNTGGRRARLCGNVGVPVVSGVDSEFLAEGQGQTELLVVEASSYQLESCSVLRPKIGVLLNISENHLERHGNIERYFKTKARLFDNQLESDIAILNIDDPLVSELRGVCRAKVYGFGARENHNSEILGGFVDYDKTAAVDRVIIRLSASEREVYDTSDSKLIGVHNRYNIAVAALVARLEGVRPEVVQQVINNFTPLSHRFEAVQYEGLPLAINDSKSTTVAASVSALKAALEAFPGKSIVMMIGGLAKAGSWDPLVAEIGRAGERISGVISFGADRELIQHYFDEGNLTVSLADTLKRGLEVALEMSSADTVLLLSPGCASFDEFRNFEDRGNMFKSYLGESSL